MFKAKKYTLLKVIFRYSLRNFVKLKNMKNSIIKDKIKINEHFDNTFTLNEQKR